MGGRGERRDPPDARQVVILTPAIQERRTSGIIRGVRLADDPVAKRSPYGGLKPPTHPRES